MLWEGGRGRGEGGREGGGREGGHLYFTHESGCVSLPHCPSKKHLYANKRDLHLRKLGLTRTYN